MPCRTLKHVLFDTQKKTKYSFQEDNTFFSLLLVVRQVLKYINFIFLSFPVLYSKSYLDERFFKNNLIADN